MNEYFSNDKGFLEFYVYPLVSLKSLLQFMFLRYLEAAKAAMFHNVSLLFCCELCKGLVPQQRFGARNKVACGVLDNPVRKQGPERDDK